MAFPPEFSPSPTSLAQLTPLNPSSSLCPWSLPPQTLPGRPAPASVSPAPCLPRLRPHLGQDGTQRARLGLTLPRSGTRSRHRHHRRSLWGSCPRSPPWRQGADVGDGGAVRLLQRGRSPRHQPAPNLLKEVSANPPAGVSSWRIGYFSDLSADSRAGSCTPCRSAGPLIAVGVTMFSGSIFVRSRFAPPLPGALTHRIHC